MADHGHDITMPARLGSQNAKAILGVVVGDALDEAGKRLAAGLLKVGLCALTTCWRSS
jgi:hypothetical protein